MVDETWKAKSEDVWILTNQHLQFKDSTNTAKLSHQSSHLLREILFVAKLQNFWRSAQLISLDFYLGTSTDVKHVWDQVEHKDPDKVMLDSQLTYSDN